MYAPGLFPALFHCLCADLTVAFPLTNLGWLQIVHCEMRSGCMKQYASVMCIEMKCCTLSIKTTLLILISKKSTWSGSPSFS